MEGKDFYEILGVPKDARLPAIRKAYYKLALKIHPDRNQDKQRATKDFQKLCLIKETLFNKRKRKHYDQFGEVDECSADFDTSYEYWRSRYEKVTMEAIEKFKKKYKNSEEEKGDLRSAYKEHRGDLKLIMDCVPLASARDVDRFIEFFDSEISTGSLKQTKKFKRSRKSISREEDLSEAKEAEELSRKLGIRKEGDLKTLILARNRKTKRNFDSFLKELETKYSGKLKRKKSKQQAMPSEEEFQMIQKQMQERSMNRRRSNGKIIDN